MLAAGHAPLRAQGAPMGYGQERTAGGRLAEYAQDPVHTRHAVTAAIREASYRTGVEYDYLLANAQIESGLNPDAQARTSSASGLFQFIEGTWLTAFNRNAKRLGIDRSLAANGTGYSGDQDGNSRKMLLQLRHDPQIAALIAATYTLENERALRRVLGRKATKAELYLAHFLGSGGASRFLRVWARTPEAGAHRILPRAARSNRAIFFTSGGKARSLEQVRRLVDEKIARALKEATKAQPSQYDASIKLNKTIWSEGFMPTTSSRISFKTKPWLRDHGTVNAAKECGAIESAAKHSAQDRSSQSSHPRQCGNASYIPRVTGDHSDKASANTNDTLPDELSGKVSARNTPLNGHRPCDHIEMCYLAGMSTSTITRVRDLVESGKMTRAGLARAAGLHANTLRDAGEEDWNPTADTLQKLELFLDSNDERPVLVGIEEIIDEARNGRMYILVDDEDRENEGDLIIPAQMATPAAINFMATHGRGLICLALDKERVDKLGLEPMSRNNKESMQTAFTISIEAKEGVTTGISAADRARTVSVAIDSTKGADDIVTPGHVFPLAARDGGTLVRAGHTEAAVDISRLAGLNPSGVICEIMNEDGSMARLDDLVEFARMHNLKIGTIRDLIAYRMRNDHLVERLGENAFESDYGGAWRMITYRDRVANDEAYVLQKGRVIEGEPTLARVHPISVFDDVLGAPGPRKRTLQRAMQAVGEHGSGIIVILTTRVGSGGEWTQDEEIRNIGIGSQILADLGVHDMILLSNSRPDLVALEGFGISITDFQPIPE